jgi:hypothetical protein
MLLQHLLFYQVLQYQFFSYFGRHFFVPGIFRRYENHWPMLTLPCTPGSYGMDGIVYVVCGNGASDLIRGIIRSFFKTGVTIADKNNVLNSVQVFSHKK